MPGLIVAPQPLAVEEGAKVLMAGGNAFDAALACAAVQFVVDPHACGVGGYLMMTVWPAGTNEPPAVLDAPALAGSRVTPEMWQDLYIGPNPRGWGFFLKGKVNEDGYLSICTPGMVRGMQAIVERWCTRSWSELLGPAIRIAHDGWMVTKHLADRWKDPPMYYEGSSPFQKLHATAEAKRIYLKRDRSGETAARSESEAGPSLAPRAPEMGETLRNPDYGRTLERLARHGPDDFYTGGLAAEMIADLDAHGSYVTADDLRDYTVRNEPPIRTTYRGYKIVSANAPHGGPTLAAILNILEGYDLAAIGHNWAEYIHVVSLAMKAAFADRNRHLADPAFVEVPVAWLVSKERAAELREMIAAGASFETSRAGHDTPDTTQVTVVDGEGNCVSLTHSLGSSSGVITPGLGFMYNNSMVNYNPLPGIRTASPRGRTARPG